jgi:hypothetical protein
LGVNGVLWLLPYIIIGLEEFFKIMDNIKWINLEINNSNKTIVAFAGSAGKLMMPVFEFFNLFKDIDINKIFVRDEYSSWYYKLGHDKVFSELHNILDPLTGVKIFAGTSAGGFAAILFGSLLKVDYVFAFSPQTFLDRETLVKYNDERYYSRLVDVYKITTDKRNLSLDYLIKENDITKYYIYYGSKHPLDHHHANIFQKHKNFYLRPLDFEGHMSAKFLKDEGKLMDIISKGLNSKTDEL